MPFIYSRLIHAYSRVFFTTVFFIAVFITEAGHWFISNAQAEESETAQTTSEQDRPLTNPTELQRMKHIATAASHEHIVWLGEGENASIASYNAANTPFQMAIIGLTSNSTDLSEANLLTYLHSELPIHGWSVLNTLLPDRTEPTLPMRKIGPGGATLNDTAQNGTTPSKEPEKNSDPSTSTSKPTNSTENANNTADKFEQTAQERIKAATNFLLEQGAQSVTLIADNDNVDRAMQASITNTASTSGLVLWQVDQSKINKETLISLKASRVSILDVLTNNQPKSAIIERKRLFAFAKFIDDYKLIQIPTDHEGEIIGGKRMRFWLTSEFRKF